MNRIEMLNQRYSESAALVRNGVEIVAVGDRAGARFNAVVRRLLALRSDQDADFLDDLIGAAKSLRWRQVTQPQPLAFNPGVQHLAGEVQRLSHQMRGALADQELLDELAEASRAVAAADPVLGAVLLESCLEVGIDSCVVVAASRSAAAGLCSWLNAKHIQVLTLGELERSHTHVEQAYVVGPPRFYRSSLVTAPATSGVTFLMPAWFGDRSVPRSVVAAYAEGAIQIEARVFTEGDTTEPELDTPPEAEDELEFLPLPAWGSRQSSDREPSSEEVEARKVILSGNLAIWLDDGERIRSLDPAQPVGERVTYTDVPAVRVGTYLLLRQGETERGALYRAAVERMPRREAVNETQIAWKQRLLEKLGDLGQRETVNQLRDAGVKTAERARAWTDPNLIRPHNDQDFQLLLEWLGVSSKLTFVHATMLRKSLYQVSAEIREQLEDAVSAADLSQLALTGNLRLDLEADGFRGIVATRVLGVAPFAEIVSRNDARVPFEDWSGQWLE